MKALTDYILKFGNLNKEQTDFIVSQATRCTLPKGEYFSEAGKIPNRVAFVLDGILRLSSYNDEGEEITNHFIYENLLVVDYENFEARLPSAENLQAVTDCELLVFSRNDWGKILNSIVGWDKIADRMYRKCLIETINKRSPLVWEDATTRYLSFLKKFPTLANRVPLSYIASYLGITQQSFSRIRRNIH
jgi:CRP-like cAMP-binding protein